MANKKSGSSIGHLKKKLDTKGPLPEDVTETLSGFSRRSMTDVNTDWEHDHKETTPPAPTRLRRRTKPKKKKPFALVFFTFSILFFIVAVSIAFVVIRGGGSNVTPKNIDLAVKGPVAVSGGEASSFQVLITNRNSVPLTFADLVVALPEGTRSAADARLAIKQIRESLGEIGPGEQQAVDIAAVLFGEEGDALELVFELEYRIQGSNAIFVTPEKIFDVQIESAPISFLVSIPREVNAGQEVPFSIEIVSNTSETIDDFMLVVEYPFGFFFERAVPAPDFENNRWALGDIEPFGRRTINVSGILDGQDDEERTFRFNGGIQSDNNERELVTPFVGAARTIAIRKPFIQTDLVLNGSTDETVVVQSGKAVQGTVVWQNNLNVPLEDVVIEAKITGDVLNQQTVRVTNGFYRSIEDVIEWSKVYDSSLALIDPGVRGELDFSFETQDLRASSAFTDPTVTIAVTAQGKRVEGQQTSGEVSSELVRIVQVASDVTLTAESLYNSGPFVNTGPIPPQAETPTTYTITWSVVNTSNTLDQTVVRAVLPTYVTWKNQTSPPNESLSFDPVTRVVTWDLGSVVPGTGVVLSPKEVSFQVELLPSISQIGSSPVLVQQASLSATDRFTQSGVSDVAPSVTTRTTTDLNFESRNGAVVQ